MSNNYHSNPRLNPSNPTESTTNSNNSANPPPPPPSHRLSRLISTPTSNSNTITSTPTSSPSTTTNTQPSKPSPPTPSSSPSPLPPPPPSPSPSPPASPVSPLPSPSSSVSDLTNSTLESSSPSSPSFSSTIATEIPSSSSLSSSSSSPNDNPTSQPTGLSSVQKVLLVGGILVSILICIWCLNRLYHRTRSRFNSNRKVNKITIKGPFPTQDDHQHPPGGILQQSDIFSNMKPHQVSQEQKLTSTTDPPQHSHHPNHNQMHHPLGFDHPLHITSVIDRNPIQQSTTKTYDGHLNYNGLSRSTPQSINGHSITLISPSPPSQPLPQLPSLNLKSITTNDHRTRSPHPPYSPPSPLDYRCKGSQMEGKTFIVERTYQAVLADELIISIGDRIKVAISYDDGWCLGENLDRDRYGKEHLTKGVLPRDCLAARPIEWSKAHYWGAGSVSSDQPPDGSSSPFGDNPEPDALDRDSVAEGQEIGSPGGRWRKKSSSRATSRSKLKSFRAISSNPSLSPLNSSIFERFPLPPGPDELRSLSVIVNQDRLQQRVSSLMVNRTAQLFLELGDALGHHDHSTPTSSDFDSQTS